MLQTYDLTLIFRIANSSDEQKKVLEEIKKIIGKEGKIKDQKDLGRRILAYKILKEKEGNYFFTKLETNTDNTAKISNFLKLSDKILRFLLVRS